MRPLDPGQQHFEAGRKRRLKMLGLKIPRRRGKVPEMGNGLVGEGFGRGRPSGRR
jgi:hypothetical protein